MTPSNPSYLKAISILHIALFFGQVLFGVVIGLLNYFNRAHPSSLETLAQQFLIACSILGLVAYAAGNYFFKKKIEQLNQQLSPVSRKLEDYRAASISRWAMMEGVTLFTIIAYYLTGNNLIILVSGILMLLFYSLRPTAQKIASDLGIRESEIE